MPVTTERAEALRRLLEAAPERPAAGAAPRVVIDTNVLMDVLHWEDPAVRDLGGLIESGELQPVRDEATLLEAAEVLDRTTFGIPFADVSAMLGRWIGMSEDAPEAALQAALRPTGTPRCWDPLDQKFLDLAVGAGAAILVTKDKLVLKTRRKMAALGIHVVKPEDVARALDDVKHGR